MHRLPYEVRSLKKCHIADGMAIRGDYAYMVVKFLPNQRVLVEEQALYVGNRFPRPVDDQYPR